MKKKIIISLFLSIGLVTVLVWTYKKFHPSQISFDSSAVWVQTEVVKTVSIPLEVNSIGTISARTVEISPEISGHVAAVLFKDGTEVNRGQTLIQLDDAVYKTKANLAKAQLNFSKHNYQRMVLLGKKNAISKQAIDQAEADLKEKRAQAEEAQVTLDKLKLTAPFTGVVSKSKVNPGDYVNVAQSLVSLTDTAHLHVEYNLPESTLPLLKLGQIVKIKSSTYPNHPFKGVVAYISPTINADNRSVSVYAEVSDSQHLLASGMFVDVAQQLGKEKEVVMVPARSLVPIIDGEQIYKVVDGKAFSVNVITAKRVGDNVQILEGINTGDQVITDGQLKVRNGTPIKIKT